MPKVSVILPSYNHERYLAQTIESILGQAFSDFELVVIDDFSRDGSAKIISKYAEQDSRIRCLFHKSNQGIARTLNEGMAISEGEYIAYTNSDDIWEKDRLGAEIEIMDRFPDVGLSYSESVIIDGDGRLTGQKFSSIYSSPTGEYSGNLFSALLRGNFICGSSILMRRESIKGLRFNEELKYLNDWLFYLESAEKNKFYYLSQPLVRYRVHERSTKFDVSGYASDRVLTLKIIFEKYSEHIKGDKEARAGLYFITGYTLCLSGQVSQGRKYLLKSVMTSPLNVKVILAALISLPGSTLIYSTMIKVYRQVKSMFHRV